jgi:hypothetical protein
VPDKPDTLFSSILLLFCATDSTKFLAALFLDAVFLLFARVNVVQLSGFSWSSWVELKSWGKRRKVNEEQTVLLGSTKRGNLQLGTSFTAVFSPDEERFSTQTS